MIYSSEGTPLLGNGLEMIEQAHTLYDATDFAFVYGPSFPEPSSAPRSVLGLAGGVTVDFYQGWKLPDNDAGIDRVTVGRFRAQSGGQGFEYQFDHRYGSQYLTLAGTEVARDRVRGDAPNFVVSHAVGELMSGLIRPRHRASSQALMAVATAALRGEGSQANLLAQYDIDRTRPGEWLGRLVAGRHIRPTR